MPRTESWRWDVPEIRAKVQEMDTTEWFYREEIEPLFGVLKRTALRLMSRIEPQQDGARPRVSRLRLLAYLENLEAEMLNKSTRLQQILTESQAQKAEIDFLRERFRGKFGIDPPSWKLTEQVIHSSLPRLSKAITLEPGRVVIEFSPDDAESCCRYLAELAAAISNDWFAFRARVAPAEAERGASRAGVDRMAAFLRELEAMRGQ